MTQCPLCASADTATEQRFTADEAAHFFVPATQSAHRNRKLAASIRRLWQRGDATNQLCRACGFGFADPYVAGDAEFYDLAFGPSGYSVDKWEFSRTL